MPTEPISREILLKVFDRLPVGVFFHDAKGLVLYVNPAAREIWGGARYVDISGYREYKGWWPSTGKRIEPEEWATARAVRRGEVTVKEEVLIETFQGERKYILNSSFPLIEKGAVTGVVTINEDITDRKKVERESEHHLSLLETVFSSIEQLIAYMDRDFNFLKVNRAYAEADDRHPDFFPGRNHFELYPDEENERIFKKVVETGEPHHEYWRPFEYREHPERGLTWWNWTLQPIKGPGSTVTGIVLSLSDVTEQKKKDEALKQSEERYRFLVENLNEGIFVLKADGKIAFVNGKMAEMLGYARQELAGKSGYELIPERLRKEAGKRLASRSRGVRDQYEMEYMKKDGSTIFVHVSASPIFEGDEFKGSLGAVVDITGRKRMEEEVRLLNRSLEKRVVERTAELNKTLEALSAANRELELFAYSIAHDLRAPLRLVDGFSRMLLKKHLERLDAEGRDQLQRIRAAARRMENLVEDLMSLSYILRADIKLEQLDLSGIATSIIEDLKKSDPQRKVEFRARSGLKAQGDAKLVRMALENLIGNSWKYTSKARLPVIEFGALEKEMTTVFYIRDNGIGFEARHAESVFKPFQRLHSADEYPGTGIGLATVKRIIERHGGRIWAEAEPGKGSTFFFTMHPGMGS